MGDIDYRGLFSALNSSFREVFHLRRAGQVRSCEAAQKRKSLAAYGRKRKFRTLSAQNHPFGPSELVDGRFASPVEDLLLPNSSLTNPHALTIVTPIRTSGPTK
jgi:hypothetical protein